MSFISLSLLEPSCTPQDTQDEGVPTSSTLGSAGTSPPLTSISPDIRVDVSEFSTGFHYASVTLSGEVAEGVLSGSAIGRLYWKSSSEEPQYDRARELSPGLATDNLNINGTISFQFPLIGSTFDQVSYGVLVEKGGEFLASEPDTYIDGSIDPDLFVTRGLDPAISPKNFIVSGMYFKGNSNVPVVMQFDPQGRVYTSFPSNLAAPYNYFDWTDPSAPTVYLQHPPGMGSTDGDVQIFHLDGTVDPVKYGSEGTHHGFQKTETGVTNMGFDKASATLVTDENGKDYCVVADSIYDYETGNPSESKLVAQLSDDMIPFENMPMDKGFQGPLPADPGLYCGDSSATLGSVTYANFISASGDDRVLSLSSNYFQGVAILKDGEILWLVAPESEAYLDSQKVGDRLLTYLSAEEYPYAFDAPHSAVLNEDNQLVVFNRNALHGDGSQCATADIFDINFDERNFSYVKTFEPNECRKSPSHGNALLVEGAENYVLTVYADGGETQGFSLFDESFTRSVWDVYVSPEGLSGDHIDHLWAAFIPPYDPVTEDEQSALDAASTLTTTGK